MVLHVIGYILELYIVVLILRALLSWFPVHPGSALASINSALWRVTEPVLAPIRRLIPPLQAGGVGFDLSFIVVIIVLEIVATAFLRA